MKSMHFSHPFLDTLSQRVLVYDGAMGTNLQKMKLTAAHFGGEKTFGCNDYLVLTYPAAVEAVHRSFLEVGVDAIETNTFRSNRITLGEYGLAERVIEINRAAASLARRLADEYNTAGQRRFVAGSIGPSGKLPSADDPDLSNIDFDELVDVFRQQAVGLIEGGVDVLLIETSQDILEVKAAILGIHEAFRELGTRLPIQAQVTLDTNGRMLLGTDIGAALAILAGMQIDVIGLNCSTGPEHMRQPIEFLGKHAPLPVSCLPNAGLPLNVDGEAVYPLEPQPFAQEMLGFVERNGIRVVGGCCGTTPQHLQLLVQGLREKGFLAPQARFFQAATFPPHLASAVRAVEMHQQPPPLLIGERCNAQGSRQFKRLLLEENTDAILDLARQQVEGGAHALDISVALTERADEADTMRKVVKLLATGVDVPLVIDTTEPEVMEVALKTAPGRCLLNSTHLEGGEAKARRVFQLAKDFNAAVLCLTIDEQGMAKTAQRKVEVAQRLFHLAVEEIGLAPEALVFDALTFTLATGDEEYRYSAIETLEGIRLIKENLPGVLTSLGVSNLSFGLAANARPVLNSVMLYHAVQKGLDMAIVNPAHITPYAEIPLNERELAEDLIFARREDALSRLIEYFAQQGPNARMGEKDQTAELLGSMTAQERLHWKVVHRHKEGVEADIDEMIQNALLSYPSPLTPPPKGEGNTHLPSPLGRGAGGEGYPSSSLGRAAAGEGELPSPLGRGAGGEGYSTSPSGIAVGGEGELPSPLGRGAGGEGYPPSATGGGGQGLEPRQAYPFKSSLPDHIKNNLRALRKNATDPEQLLWRFLRNRAFHDVKFRRQHPIGGYILDFYSHEARLGIELDGSQHNSASQFRLDEQRTHELEQKFGIKIIRFWNHDVLNRTQMVLEELWRVLDERLNPSPLKAASEGAGAVAEDMGNAVVSPSPLTPPPKGEGNTLPPSPLGRGVGGEGQSPAPLDEGVAGEGQPTSPLTALSQGTGVGTADMTIHPSPLTPPPKGEGDTFPPSPLGRGVGGEGQSPAPLDEGVASEGQLASPLTALSQGTGAVVADMTMHPSPLTPPPKGEGDTLLPSPLGRGAGGEGLEGVEGDLKKIQHQAAVQILNHVLLPAMKEVGDKFGAGELILPFVLQSAEVMKKAVSHLENYLEKQEGTTKGKIVLATVYGDVHDIGKNLVKTILSNNGYTVIDLGKQVPAETIISTAVEQKADAIGLSALLVSTSRQMPLIVNELHRRSLKFPVLIGGAAINRRFGWRILFTEDQSVYEPGVFYCKDAFEGLAVMDQLMQPEKRQALLEKVRQDARREVARPLQSDSRQTTQRRSTVLPKPLQLPPGVRWGSRVVREMPLRAVFQCLFKNDLFRLSWGAKNAHGEEWERLHRDFEQRLDLMQRQALQQGWLRPQAAYGYWPCQSEGDELILYDPDTLRAEPSEWVELMRFAFPRQEDDEHLCLADYFASRESGVIDVVAFQVVTVGHEATEYFDRLQAEGNYTEAYFVHGLAVQTAEAAAEYLHRHIRRELGIPEGQGKRYSWGYPAIPELEDHRKVFDLLPVEKEFGMSLTAAFQLVPEQSTAAIIVHHPQAKYYAVGGSRVEQLMRG